MRAGSQAVFASPGLEASAEPGSLGPNADKASNNDSIIAVKDGRTYNISTAVQDAKKGFTKLGAAA